MSYSLDITNPLFTQFSFNKGKITIILDCLISQFWWATWNPMLRWFKFCENEQPCIMYLNNWWIIICLTKNAENDIYRTCYQMSHELFHFITSNWPDTSNTLNLEEGLAVYSSILWCCCIFWKDNPYILKVEAYLIEKGRKYWLVYNAIKTILKKYPFCIKTIRERHFEFWLDTHISSIKKEELLNETNWEFESEISFLMQKFYVNRN